MFEIFRVDSFLSVFIEPFLLAFFLGGVYFYLKGFILLSSFFFALFINSKNFIVYSFLFYLALFLDISYFYFKKEKGFLKEKLKILVFTLLFSLIFLYFNYLKVLVDTRDLLQPLKIQKYIFYFYQDSVKVPPFMIFKMIFLNKWPIWWADRVKSVPGWWFGWPVAILVFGYFLIKKRRFDFLIAWVVIYFLFLNFIPVWPRYFILFFIPLYISLF